MNEVLMYIRTEKDLGPKKPKLLFVITCAREIPSTSIKRAVSQLKSGYSTGSNNMACELFAALDGFGTVQIANIANNVSNSGSVSEEMLESVFMT